MTKDTFPVIAGHNLSHFQQLRADRILFEKVFAFECFVHNCNGKCCREGVYADSAEKENIVAYADIVRKYMDRDQEHDDLKWFESEERVDSDYPSGRCVGTETNERGCVFLNSEMHCVLQKAGDLEGMGKHSLKPFYCFGYPITIDRGVLTIHEPEFANRPQCCGISTSGVKTAMDAFHEELDFMLGAEGYQYLKSLQEQ
jgi:hypothetical protein